MFKSYFLTLTSFQPLYGKLSDIFGRKQTLLVAYAFFGVGCVFCGLARNLEELVAARAFAGTFPSSFLFLVLSICEIGTFLMGMQALEEVECQR
jgi:MFS family permease